METTPKRAAGRPREFDPAATAAQAIAVFREHGFRGTTTRHLEATLGVNQSSLYRVFKSKEQLLHAALDAYDDFTEEHLLGPLRGGSGGLGDIDQYFATLGANLGNGCLLVALMGQDPAQSVRARTTRYRKAIRDAMHAALVRAADQGEIPSSAVMPRASLLVSVVLGINTAARGGAEPQELATLIDAARSELVHWSPDTTATVRV